MPGAKPNGDGFDMDRVVLVKWTRQPYRDQRFYKELVDWWVGSLAFVGFGSFVVHGFLRVGEGK